MIYPTDLFSLRLEDITDVRGDYTFTLHLGEEYKRVSFSDLRKAITASTGVVRAKLQVLHRRLGARLRDQEALSTYMRWLPDDLFALYSKLHDEYGVFQPVSPSGVKKANGLKEHSRQRYLSELRRKLERIAEDADEADLRSMGLASLSNEEQSQPTIRKSEPSVEWNGTLNELADKVIEEQHNYSSLRRACLDCSVLYKFHGKKVNFGSLYTTAKERRKI